MQDDFNGVTNISAQDEAAGRFDARFNERPRLQGIAVERGVTCVA